MKRGTSREHQRQATALRVLVAARDEFEARGFEEASIRRIAARARVSVGTVIHHYGDKRQLLYAALHEALDGALSTSSRAMGRGPLAAQLMRLARAVFDVYAARPALARTLLKEALFADGPWGARFVEQAARAHAAVRRLAVAAVERGELPAATDVDALGLAFLSFFYFALVSWVQDAPLPRGPMGLVERLLASYLGPPLDAGRAATKTTAPPAATRRTAKTRARPR